MATHHGERLVQGNGIEICTDAFGDPVDPTILLVNGAGGSMLGWREELCQRLADARRFVIRYDNRDTGKTTPHCPPGEPNYTLDGLANDAVAVLDAYQINQAHIVGISMGGMITQLIGLNHPNRALTLTPIMSTPQAGVVTDAFAGKEVAELSPPHPRVLELVANRDQIDWSDRDTVIRMQVESFATIKGSRYPEDPDMTEYVAREFDRALNYASSVNHTPAIAQSNAWHHRLHEINIPTLVIHGDEDPQLPDHHRPAHPPPHPRATLLTQ
ncbi:MAG: alpha/beta hydrolase, partial [Chloroflexota bacterium]|nr:alpha/beta hydrolase [Chloroflexota bacterium]